VDKLNTRVGITQVSIQNSVRIWLAAPVFDGDAEKTRVAGLLNAVLLSLFLAPLLVAVNAIFNPAVRPMASRLIIVIMVALSAMLYFMRRGHVRAVSLVMVASMLLLTGYVVVLNGGQVRPANLYFALVIVIAALLLGGRGAIGSAIASALIIGVVTYAGSAGLITARLQPPPLALAWVSQAVAFILIGVVLRLASNSLGAALVMAQQSIRDPVTGLFNRRYMEETLERELARAARAKGPVSIIMLDIDHFKHFNDTFGHEAGDLVLREIGACLRAQIRAEDIACRYGGEEFTLIMPAASVDIARQRAEHMREQVKGLTVQHHGQALGQITASLGVAVYPEDGETGETVLAAADAALYRAKRAGRNRVMVTQSSHSAA
jgi:diguanylate cyclase (GGDEF)-like protein